MSAFKDLVYFKGNDKLTLKVTSKYLDFFEAIIDMAIDLLYGDFDVVGDNTLWQFDDIPVFVSLGGQSGQLLQSTPTKLYLNFPVGFTCDQKFD